MTSVELLPSQSFTSDGVKAHELYHQLKDEPLVSHSVSAIVLGCSREWIYQLCRRKVLLERPYFGGTAISLKSVVEYQRARGVKCLRLQRRRKQLLLIG